MPLPAMYGKLAPWFHLITAPESYEEEATFYLKTLSEALGHKPKTMLELGSGGGNNASHIKKRVPAITLVDLSPKMLALSRTINPELEHRRGDMRTLRLGRESDAVFVHDAVQYMTTRRDLLAAMRTAFAHLRPGGVALFAPDYVRETFEPSTHAGGHDDPKTGRGARYLEWVYDPNPRDTHYHAEYALLLRDRDGSVSVHHDRHIEGLFPRAAWLSMLRQAGFRRPRAAPFKHSELVVTMEVFVGVR